MKRSLAKEISEIITPQQLMEMFKKAMNEITDWSEVSVVNKGMSKGTAWNILVSDFYVDDPSFLCGNNLGIKFNMIREFGDYLPDELKIRDTDNTISRPIVITHQEPNFKKFN